MRKFLSIVIASLLFLGYAPALLAQSPPKPRDTTIAGPQTFAMIMGISTYKYVPPLTYADKDAEMFRDYLKSPAGGSVSSDNIYCLLNEQALLANFYTKGFQWLKAKKLQKDDRLFIYLAGHGDAIDEEQFFYIAYDCNPAGDRNNYLVGGAIQLFNLKKKIQAETAKGVHVYFIMDACRSNELPGGAEGQNFLNSAISEKRAGEIIMLATGAGQESLEDASIGSGHGLFTYYLVDGLSGSADTTGDKMVTLEEIQHYVDKHVPQIAQERFKRKQEPFFCCSETGGSDKVIGRVDTAYFKRWLQLKKQNKGPGTSYMGPPGKRGFNWSPIDTQLIETYNLFNNAIKQSKLIGAGSADYYYELLARNFPGSDYTLDAQSTLAVEFINFAQSKINQYLDCKDASSIQKIRAQIDEDEKTDEITTSLDRMEKVARQEFYEVGNMLQKAISIIMPDDPDFAQTLMGRMYFFKARGYFGRGRKMVDINDAFRYAYTAYAADKNAAYILNTLSALHLDNNRLDSSIHYAKRAIETAPRWRYPYVTLAYCYKTQNKPDSAIKYYRKAIEVDPSNADAYVDLGHYFYSLSRKDSAVAYYQRALQIEPQNVFASNNIGWVNYDKKNYNDAIRYFKRSIAADPKYINAYNGLSKTFFATGQYDSARIYYSKAFSNYKDKSIVNVYIGNFFKDLKQYDSAKVYYRMAFALDPNYEEAYNDLGQTFYALKEYDSARHYYHRALQVNPYSAYSMINMGLVYKQLKQADSTYSYFQQAIGADPFNPSILNNLGVIYGQDKSFDSAKNYFRRALQVRPDYKPASNNLIKIFKELNMLDSVTKFLQGSSLYDRGSTAYFNDMGLAFLDLKRFDSARAYFRNAIKFDPQNAQYLSNMGLALQGMKNHDSAKVYLQRALRQDPENHIIWNNLALSFRQLKMGDSAAFYYKKQLMKRSDITPQVYQNIGNFYADMDYPDSAIAYYRKAMELDRNYAPAYNKAGASFMVMEQNDSAFKYFSKAVTLDPKYPGAELNLGLLYHNLAKYDSAIVHIQNAIRLDPKPKSYYQLGVSYALNNKPELAIQNLKLAYEKGYKNFDNLISDPDLLGLKDNKDFQALLDKYVPDWKNK
jgi:tetratricopeptide (TPR) repeat protein